MLNAFNFKRSASHIKLIQFDTHRLKQQRITGTKQVYQTFYDCLHFGTTRIFSVSADTLDLSVVDTIINLLQNTMK